MNETESVARASAFITQIEAFAHAHPFVTAWVAATLLSWVLTATFKKPIRAVLPDSWDAWGVRAFDVLVAGVAAFALLKLLAIPLAWLIVMSLAIGGTSPIAYGVVASLICWKWPAAKRFLTLSELASDPSPNDPTEGNTP